MPQFTFPQAKTGGLGARGVLRVVWAFLAHGAGVHPVRGQHPPRQGSQLVAGERNHLGLAELSESEFHPQGVRCRWAQGFLNAPPPQAILLQPGSRTTVEGSWAVTSGSVTGERVQAWRLQPRRRGGP